MNSSKEKHYLNFKYTKYQIKTNELPLDQYLRGPKNNSYWKNKKCVFYCGTGGFIRGLFYMENNLKFKDWIKTDQAKDNILHFGPYYPEYIYNGQVYPGHCPELQKYYEKFDDEYHQKYIEKNEKKILDNRYREEFELLVKWYTENKYKSETPKIAIDCVKTKIDEFTKFFDNLDLLKHVKMDKYKKINNITYLSW